MISKTKRLYKGLCKNDTRLPENPEQIFGKSFISWIDYLDINTNDYYTLKQCKMNSKRDIKKHNLIKNNRLNIKTVCDKLHKLNAKYPPADMWVDIYSLDKLSDIIELKSRKKTNISKIIKKK